MHKCWISPSTRDTRPFPFCRTEWPRLRWRWSAIAAANTGWRPARRCPRSSDRTATKCELSARPAEWSRIPSTESLSTSAARRPSIRVNAASAACPQCAVDSHCVHRTTCRRSAFRHCGMWKCHANWRRCWCRRGRTSDCNVCKMWANIGPCAFHSRRSPAPSAAWAECSSCCCHRRIGLGRLYGWKSVWLGAGCLGLRSMRCARPLRFVR